MAGLVTAVTTEEEYKAAIQESFSKLTVLHFWADFAPEVNNNLCVSLSCFS